MCLVPGLSAAPPAQAELLAATQVDSVIQAALATLVMTPQDLTLPADYAADLPLSLPRVAAALEDPRGATHWVDGWARALLSATRTEEVARELVPAVAVRAPESSPAGSEPCSSWDACFPSLVQAFQRYQGLGVSGAPSQVLEVAQAVLRFDDESDSQSLEAILAAEDAALADAERFAGLAAATPWRQVVAFLPELCRWVDALLYNHQHYSLEASARGAPRSPVATVPSAAGSTTDPPATGDVWRWERLPDGRACILGGPGPTVYTQPPALVIDVGGDDIYTAGAAGAGWGTTAVVIDLAGNDVYLGEEPFSLAGAQGGVALLVDLGGDDVYKTPAMGLGAAVAGAALLIDEAGDDFYAVQHFGAGAAGLGVAALVDRDGRDLYQGGTLTQGCGWVAGAGVLADRNGADIYVCQPRVTDTLRDAATTYSMSQGFGYGMRPDAAGGIGLLADGAGNDRYVAEVFGQGGAYWYGLGALVDVEGNDHYSGYNYTQGSGVHLAVGVLLDGAGDDRYQAAGVSQGTGHDYAYGALLDLGGADAFGVRGLSQGAGNANGIGLLVALGGPDLVNREDPNALGYGNFRRHFGSVGVAVFAGSGNRYSGDPTASPNTLWWQGTHGVGIDAPIDTLLQAAKPTRVAAWPALTGSEVAVPAGPRTPLEPKRGYAAGADSTALRKLPATALLRRAARGEPRFRALRDAAMAELQRRGAPALGELTGELNAKVARRIHTLKDLAVAIGPAARQPLVDALNGLAPRGVRAALWCLERMEAPDCAQVARPFLRDANWRVRAQAAKLLAPTGDGEDVPYLVAALGDPNPGVRRSAAYALGEQAASWWRAGATERRSLRPLVEPLIAAADDPHYSVRFSAARALAGCGPQAAPAIATALRTATSRAAPLLIEALAGTRDPRAAPLFKSALAAGGPIASRARLALAAAGDSLAIWEEAGGAPASWLDRASLAHATRLLDD